MTSRMERNQRLITSLEKGTWTSRTYREAVLKQIQNIVPYDAYCFTTVDPQTLLSTGAVTEDGIEAVHDRLFVNEYMEEDIHKYADLIHSGDYTAILHASISENPVSSVRYHNILQPAGFGDELRAVLVSAGACWGYLTLYRRTEEPVFTEEERLSIQAWTPSIALMLRSTSLTLLDEMKSGSPSDPGIMITSDAFELLSVNAPAQYWLSQLRLLEHVGPDVLPRPVRAVSSHLQRQIRTDSDLMVVQEPILHSPSKVCIQLLDGRYLVLHASRMQQLSGPDQIAIRLEQAMPQDLLPLLAESHGLSIRERELLGYVLRSYSSKEIAEAMHISAYTVQDHLKSIFAKTNVSSRRELIWYFVSRFQLSDEPAI
ncbi:MULTISPECIES: helix-turn-helix transcriptional regulator [unclassified Paenibacillus]|uniref:helix-turn-helix transcriptional regulator n=1 Tax=unclassified Paenibacillus TaxID=185978 RepID=UPI0008C63BFA|nr:MULTISPECIES: helix-turn-helix transcriptional regulator [unclassified Paenibacillus]QLG41063.1 helix-turn-helix transcriptional regulator [Paenibacillus sp. E222]SEN41734.1 regulatory protein, luxR family [Paenibacillus sp. OK076]